VPLLLEAPPNEWGMVPARTCSGRLPKHVEPFAPDQRVLMVVGTRTVAIHGNLRAWNISEQERDTGGAECIVRIGYMALSRTGKPIVPDGLASPQGPLIFRVALAVVSSCQQER
jgi:hypothetical protein